MKYGMAAVLLLLALSGTAVAADTSLPQELQDAAPRAAELMDLDDPAMGFGDGLRILWGEAADEVRQYAQGGIRRIGALLAGVTVLGAAESLAGDRKSRINRCIHLIGAVWIVSVTAGDVSALIGLGQETVMEMSHLSRALFPAVAMATAASGGVTGAAVRQAASVFFSDVLLTVMEKVLLPGVYLFIGAATADAVLEEGPMEQLAAMMKKVMTWGLCGIVTVFTGYLTISGAVSGAIDAHAVRTAQAAVTAAVPVVGRILSRASESVLAGAALLRSMVGVCGTLGVVGLCLGPVLHLGIQYGLYKIASLLAAAVEPGVLTKLLGRLGDAFGLLLGMTASSAAVLLISLVSSMLAVTS